MHNNKLRFCFGSSFYLYSAVFIVFTFSKLSFAGGISITEGTFEINYKQQPWSVSLDMGLQFDFIANQYVYSRGGDLGYVLFVLTKKQSYKLTSTIGRNQTNNSSDILFIKSVFSSNGQYFSKIDDKWDNELYESIMSFQRAIGIEKPDGIINLNSITHQAILQLLDSYLLAPLEPREGQINYSVYSPYACIDFLSVGTYSLQYCQVPFFVSDLPLPVVPAHSSVGYGDLIPLIGKSKYRIVKLIRSHYPAGIGEINVTNQTKMDSIAIFLSVDGKTPGTAATILSGIRKTPAHFEWYTKPHVDTAFFRIRILPDTNWSMWSHDTTMNISYLSKGNHVLQVDAQYISPDGKKIFTPSVKCALNIQETFIAEPETTFFKAGSGILKNQSFKGVKSESFYQKKIAILFGITIFNDSSFSPLPFISNDISLMNNTLNLSGFDVHIDTGSVTEKEITYEIRNICKQLTANDLLLIYISAHGFNIGALPFIACSDCIRATAKHCFSLDSIALIIDSKRQKGKHVIILLDACSAGLGVIDKAGDFPEREMVTKRGALMITAGLESQTAQMINKLHSSVFTYYLKRGLMGEADYIKDSVITASELLTYVRYNVAKETNGMQVPMMGRLWGSGEMVFRLPIK